MSDEEAFLRAIAANPDDDTPRLVYADWLDDSGRPEQAEFVRVSVELGQQVNPSSSDYYLLWKRKEDLLHKHGTEFFPPALKDVVFNYHLSAIRQTQPDEAAAKKEAEQTTKKTLERQMSYSSERGIMTFLELTPRQFIESAPSLFPRTAISRVTFAGQRLDENNEINPDFWPALNMPEMRQVRYLNLDKNGLGAGVADLGRCEHLSNLDYLNLRDNPLGPSGLRALGQCSNLHNLTVLGLNNTFQHAAQDNIEEIARWRNFPRLETLNLSRNGLETVETVEAVQPLCQAIRQGHFPAINHVWTGFSTQEPQRALNEAIADWHAQRRAAALQTTDTPPPGPDTAQSSPHERQEPPTTPAVNEPNYWTAAAKPSFTYYKELLGAKPGASSPRTPASRA